MAPLNGGGWTTSPPAGDSLLVRVEEPSAAAACGGGSPRSPSGSGSAGSAWPGPARGDRGGHEPRQPRAAGRDGGADRRSGETALLEFVCVDRGPGIADVPVSRADGYSTSGTLGSDSGRSSGSPTAAGCSRCPGRARCCTRGSCLRARPPGRTARTAVRPASP
ncbi:hypothetical protein LUX57_52595 [Actinomadura madurae]|uniref:hypothetical protein n=1 Tax=Actinomadura madurae TaxID=1993 RepID=UPI0020D22F6C|nr:hypothetical protein [Actinomadura madurae]MCP9972660.1 hypothetical protein [Actinomadura madurae]